MTQEMGATTDRYVELSFVIRIIALFAIFGLALGAVYLILRLLEACMPEATLTEVAVPEINETSPILPAKETSGKFGMEDLESSLCSSSEELYDGKICVICYDKMRNCFFVPCGHGVTCIACAKRIIEEESRVCPICRRVIHKVRKILST